MRLASRRHVDLCRQASAVCAVHNGPGPFAPWAPPGCPRLIADTAPPERRSRPGP
ncbi:putative leader peptide [Streptomyces sp. NPDC048473]|uniref:putative leader peptide n=1 Tax=unclassified Streptomyces TaxID=2593676 RepID=UPI00371BDE0E